MMNGGVIVDGVQNNAGQQLQHLGGKCGCCPRDDDKHAIDDPEDAAVD